MPNKKNPLNGIWFGATQLIDKKDSTSFYPIYYYLQFSNDSLIENKNKFYYSAENDTLYFNNKKIPYSVNGQILLLNNVNYLAKTQYSNPKIEEKLKKIREANEIICYENNNFSMKIKQDKCILKFTQNELTSSALEYCYKIDTIAGYYFFRIYGNKWDCNTKNKFYSYQIIDIDDNDNLCLYGFLNKKIQHFKLTRKETSDHEYAINNIDNFSLCNNFININNPWFIYYSTGAKYKGGIYRISKKAQSMYVNYNNNENGLIRIRFIVNCKGQIGRFDVLELDNNYKIKKFDLKISTQILNIVKNLDEWSPGTIDGINIDSYLFLTFKIKNGKITEIFP